jgi:hypothetical protein
MATQPYDDSPPDVSERYESASCTSDLTVGGGMIPKDHRAGQGDVVAAAGLAGGRLRPDGKGGYILLPPNDASMGMALLRLHSEWAASAKPRRIGPAVVDKLAEDMRRAEAVHYEASKRHGPQQPYKPRNDQFQRAEREAQGWYTNEMRLLATRLKSRHDALEQLTMWAAVKGIGSDTTAEALLHWLDPSCPTCNGLGVRHFEHQAARVCGKCYGSGERPRMEGVWRVLQQIEYALGIARGKLRKRLRKPTNGY